ncbi:MAG: alpha/beta hydrolase [Alphaproteobacteria bacterium]
MSETHIHTRVDGLELAGELYRPAGDGPAPYLVEVHGGAWQMQDRLSNKALHEDLAAGGVGVFALDFRLSTQAKYPAPVADVSHGIRWFKANLDQLGVKASKVGGLGFSSGGQQLGLVALCPAGAAYTNDDPALAGVDASVDFVALGWPILDPLARYRFVQASGNERIQAAHHAYFADEAAMAAGSPHLLLTRGEATHKPPMLVLQGTEDSNVEHHRADLFADAYRAAGGHIEVVKYDGQPHTFISANPDSDAAADAKRRIRDFALGQALA